VCTKWGLPARAPSPHAFGCYSTARTENALSLSRRLKTEDLSLIAVAASSRGTLRKARRASQRLTLAAGHIYTFTINGPGCPLSP